MKVLLFTSTLLLCNSWISKPVDYSKCITGDWKGSIPVRITLFGEQSEFDAEFVLTLKADDSVLVYFENMIAHSWYMCCIDVFGKRYSVSKTNQPTLFDLSFEAETDEGNFLTEATFNFRNCNFIDVTYTDKKGKEGTLQLTRQ